MTLKDAIAYIQARLAAVSGIGPVWDFEPLEDDPSEFLNHFRYQDPVDSGWIINGWTITQNGSTPNPEGGIGVANTATYRRRYVVLLRGYYSVITAKRTEETARGIKEAAIAAFDNRPYLTDDIQDNADGSVEPAIERFFEPRFFGDLLCHYTEIELPVQLRRDRV